MRKRNQIILAASVMAPQVLFILAVAVLVTDGLQDEPGRADVAIVFGNKVERNGKPSRRLEARLDRALEVMRAGDAGAVIVSEGTGKEGFAEAEVMRDYLVAHGLDPAIIIVDNHGANTHLTAVNSKRIMDEHHWTSAVAVTQYFHEPRSRLALHQAGIATVYTSHAPYFETLDLFSVPREVVAYVKYVLWY